MYIGRGSGTGRVGGQERRVCEKDSADGRREGGGAELAEAARGDGACQGSPKGVGSLVQVEFSLGLYRRRRSATVHAGRKSS